MTRERHTELQHRIEELELTIETLEERRDDLKWEQYQLLISDPSELDEGAIDPAEKGRSRVRSIKAKIAELDNGANNGALTEAVVDEIAEEVDLDEEEIEDQIERLKRRGELYQPDRNRLRCT